MYGWVVNFPRPSYGIHTFVLKWYMTIVPDVITLQYYPPAVNIPPSNDNKSLLQTAINQAITMGYKISSQKSSMSSSTFSWKRKLNRQRQKYEAPGVTPI